VSGKSVSETTQTLLKETDEKAIVSSIGPAGENRVGCALVVGDAYSGAGGTGAGAVMGSKNLKAVVVRGLQGFRLADGKRFLRSATELRSWMSKRSIAAKGSLQHGSVLMADNLEWDEATADIKPARTRGCFGCATSFSSFVCDGSKGFLPLSAGSPPEMLLERLKEYRSFVDLGLDFAAAKEFLASRGKGAAGNPVELARILASGHGTEWEGRIDAEIDHGPCMAAGYAIVPRIDSGSGLAAVLDSAGLCPYLVAGISMETIAELLAAATGSAFTPDELVRTGQRISGAEDTQRGG
jgi:hypothetical protein